MTADRFPIAPVLPEILARLAVHPRLVLEAPPGAGKTTQVPLALLAAPWCTGKVIVLEPRRIAARAAAAFMAEQRGEAVGASVGYRIRFEAKISKETRIEIVTDAILSRRLQEDPELAGVSAILFDEFHERHLTSDLGLALCLDVQASLRPELRLVVMSATLDGERLAAFLEAPRLSSPGRSHPVEIAHLAARPREPAELHFKRAVQLALAETAGDVLCFLPGKAEIERAARTLGAIGAEIAVLHGELAMEEQARMLRPGTGRRVVLATNVAESSVTLPGVRAVVDSGLAREPRFDPASGMSRLETVFITQASATQRAGRAGRVAPGRCYRLWPQSQRLDPATRPEMNCVELSAFLLEMKVWGSDTLRFPDPPPPGARAQASAVLQSLGALDAHERPTAHGKRLLDLGVHPRLANAILRAPAPRTGLACDIAAVLDAGGSLGGEAGRSDDLRARIALLHAARDGRAARGTLHRAERAAQHWRRRLGCSGRDAAEPARHDVGNLLALAYPDRVAKQDGANPLRYQLSNGRGALLKEESPLYGEPWLAVAELRFDARNSLVLSAAPLDPAFLAQAFPERFTAARQLRFDRETRAVEALEEKRFGALVLEQRALPVPRDEATAATLLAGIAQLGLDCLPWTAALREWQARVDFLRRWCPELELPDVGDAVLAATLEDWLKPCLADKARLGEIDSAAFAEAVQQRLGYRERKHLDEHAPAELLVPSGRHRKLSYARGETPVLAVQLQEIFGLADTPRIARGRVAVVLHLLSPRQAPLQVTQDLKSFWARTYPEVKKEMKIRYPKHAWPDDPWTAKATHRTTRRGE